MAQDIHPTAATDLRSICSPDQTGSATEGTGLGLAITSRLVELHGSKLGIESQPGEGTCFYFSLSLVAIILDQLLRRSYPCPRARKTPRILVIEDNE